MRWTALVLAGIALAACSKRADDDSGGGTASTGNHAAEGNATAPGSSAAGPSFDCTRADGQAQELVCSDPELAAIDRELDRTYRLASGDAALEPAVRDQLTAIQPGWVKGRDDCWKADDLRQCVVDAYGERIAGLRTVSAAARGADGGLAAGPVNYRCAGLEGGLAATFINSEPGVVHLSGRGLNTTLARVESASGSKYQGRVHGEQWAFWTKSGEAVLTQPGERDHACREVAQG